MKQRTRAILRAISKTNQLLEVLGRRMDALGVPVVAPSTGPVEPKVITINPYSDDIQYIRINGEDVTIAEYETHVVEIGDVVVSVQYEGEWTTTITTTKKSRHFHFWRKMTL